MHCHLPTNILDSIHSYHRMQEDQRSEVECLVVYSVQNAMFSHVLDLAACYFQNGN